VNEDYQNICDILAGSISDKRLREVFTVGFAAACVAFDLLKGGLLKSTVDVSIFNSVPSRIGLKEFNEMRDLFPFLHDYFYGAELLFNDEIIEAYLSDPSIQLYYRQLYAFGLCVLKANG
jgi:hypothetical protein